MLEARRYILPGVLLGELVPRGCGAFPTPGKPQMGSVNSSEAAVHVRRAENQAGICEAGSRG